MRWIIEHLIWDTTGSARKGLGRALWATRKVIVAVVLSALLTWREWVEHHPPAIAIVAPIHFLFVLAAIALVVYIWQFARGDKRSPSRRA
jgi:hypothetical protein